MRGVFVSDLHLFSRRSIGQRHMADLRQELRQSDWLVLGGDIFDFRWSHHGAREATVSAAQNWLGDLLDTYHQLQIAYVLGNHDSALPFRTALQELALDQSRFGWAEYAFRLGNELFLHGDVLDAGHTSQALEAYRARFAAEAHARGNVANWVYDAVVATRMHRIPGSWLHRPSQITQSLAQYVRAWNLAPQHGVQRVYFGHTHQPMGGRMLHDQAFYNPGSGIRHLPFIPCFFQVVHAESGESVAAPAGPGHVCS